MTPTVRIDATQFNSAIRQLSGGVRSRAGELSNQIALDVSREWFNHMPPPISAIEAKRREIRDYLRQPLATNIKLAKSGKSKGKLVRRGSKANQLRRVHLIVQARRRNEGKRGLYGSAMKTAAGNFARRAQTSVGYLKVMLLPVIRGLNPLVKYKMPWSETGGSGNKIAIWPGSKGFGKVTPAAGKNPLTILNLRWSLRGPREGLARVFILAGWNYAVQFKLQKLRNRIEREMNPEFSKVTITKKAA